MKAPVRFVAIFATVAVGFLSLPAVAGTCLVSGNQINLYTVTTDPPTDDCFASSPDTNINDTDWGPKLNLGPNYTTVYGYVNLPNTTDGNLTLDPSDGSFSISGLSNVPWALVLKQGNQWAAFMLPEGVFDGTYEVCNEGNGSCTFEISHAMIVGGDSFQVVPLPAAAWLLGSGLLGLFAVGRRRKGAQVVAA